MKVDEKALQVLIDGGAEVTLSLGLLMEAIGVRKAGGGGPPEAEEKPAAAPAPAAGGKGKGPRAAAAPAPAEPAEEPASAGDTKGAKKSKEQEMKDLLAQLADAPASAAPGGEEPEAPEEEE